MKHSILLSNRTLHILCRSSYNTTYYSLKCRVHMDDTAHELAPALDTLPFSVVTFARPHPRRMQYSGYENSYMTHGEY